MGNERSGRRFFWGAKATVEESRSLDIVRWGREGLLRPGTCRSGTWGWHHSRTGEVQSTIAYSIDLSADPHVRLQYVFTKTGEQLDYRVELVCTRPHYGGLRWWFLCPVSVAGRPCRRRVRKLYLAPGSTYYACRQCCCLS